MKCRICRTDDMAWAWQPLGPNETPDSFSLLGCHYRGFPAILICQKCKEDIQSGSPLEFKYKKQKYIYNNVEGCPVPEYVEDSLLYWETRTTEIST